MKEDLIFARGSCLKLQKTQILYRKYYSDEATFNRCGIVNLHNSHVWADENPHALIETNSQRQFSTNIWAGILGDKIIGPVILP